MLNSTKRPQQEQLHSQTNAGETTEETSSTKLVEREQIEGTPFTLIKVPEKGWMLTLGKYRLSEPKHEKNELILQVKEKNWGLIMQLIEIVAEATVRVIEEEKKQETV